MSDTHVKTDETTRRSVASRLAFLRSPGWLGAIAGALAFAAVCFWVLAPWQFHRHVERDLQNSEIAVAAGASPVPVQERLTTSSGPAPGETWQRVTATGEFLTDQQVAVRLRQNENNGQPASEILVPLQLSDGTILLVDRGYVTINSMQNGARPPAAPSGEVTVTGRVQPFQPDPLHRAPVRVGERLEVYGIDADSITDLPGPVLGGFIQLVDGSPGVLTPISVPQQDPGPFFSYAWQWLAFGTLAILALGFFIYREFTDPREPVSDDPAQPAQPGANRSGPGANRSGRAPRQRKQRKGFDRSSLYDQP